MKVTQSQILPKARSAFLISHSPSPSVCLLRPFAVLLNSMAVSSKHDNYPVLSCKNSRSFERWLAKNHAKAEGVWLKIAKAASGISSINHAEALDEALCYGWIDGLRRGLDEHYFVQKFTPRQPNSSWSVINKKKVAALAKAGRMQAAGLAVIETAKKNGRWKSAYNSQKTITVPPDLQQALDRSRKAKTFFEKLSSQNRYAILFRIGQVKKTATRVKKIKEYVAMLQKHETIYPQK